MPNYQTLKQAGYCYIKYIPHSRSHVLQDKETGKLEVFQASKNFAGWALKYKNTHLEFCHSLS